MPTLVLRPGTVVQAANGSATPSWILPDLARVKDNIATAANIRPFGNETKTKLLVFTNFGVDFDGATVTIDNIKVRIWGAGVNSFISGEEVPAYVLDDIVKLTKNGTVLVGNNVITTDYWDTFLAGTPHYYPMEHDGGLWGTTWTQAEVEASTFGVAVAVKTDQWSNGLYGSIPNIDGIELEIEYTEYEATNLIPDEVLELTFGLGEPVITFVTPTEVEVTVSDVLDPFEEFLYYVLETSDTLEPVEVFQYYLTDIVEVLEPDEEFAYSGLKFGDFTETLNPSETFAKIVYRLDFADYLTATEAIVTTIDLAYGVSHILVPDEGIGHSEVGLITGAETLSPAEGFVGYIDVGTCRIDRIYHPRSTHT